MSGKKYSIKYHTEKAKEFIEFILDRYKKDGVKELDEKKNYQMKENEYHSKKDIGKALEEVNNDLIHIKEN
jgi:type I restriction enzyme R subunit